MFTTLSATGLLPHAVRETYFDVYKLKAVPMILAWAVIHAQLLFYRRAKEDESPSAPLARQQESQPPVVRPSAA